MRKAFLWFLLLVVEAVFVAAPITAYAVPTTSSGVTSTTAILNRIINSTPGLNTVTTTGTGVVVTGAGEVTVTGGGLTIPIAETAAGGITAGRLAGMTARAIRYGSWVGVAAVVIPWIADQYGIFVCPPPDFFCKKGPPTAAPSDGKTGFYTRYSGHDIYATTGDDVCQQASAYIPDSESANHGKVMAYTSSYPNQGYVGKCINAKEGYFQSNVGYIAQTCGAGTTATKQADGTTTCTVASNSNVPASEGDIAGAVEGAVTGNAGRMGDLYGSLTSGNVSLFSNGDGVTVTAPPVTVPPVTTTTNVTNPDGSTSVVNRRDDTVIKPAISGSTFGDTKIDYPATTTTTTTTTNPATNQTTTTTTVTNYNMQPGTSTNNEPATKPPVVPAQSPNAVGQPAGNIQIPTDYNREPTQQKILDQLKAMNGPITATAPTGDDAVAAVKAQNDTNIGVLSGITEGSTGLKGWFPDLPTAACANPTVPNPITGAMVAVPICEKVSVFQTFISGVICVFALFGSVREVQAAMKA